MSTRKHHLLIARAAERMPNYVGSKIFKGSGHWIQQEQPLDPPPQTGEEEKPQSPAMQVYFTTR
ncbi:MAG: hypothetical protein Q8M37_12110 [Nevskia sp.]|nr:hypothetical protein [Nevskia sp.]